MRKPVVWMAFLLSVTLNYRIIPELQAQNNPPPLPDLEYLEAIQGAFSQEDCDNLCWLQLIPGDTTLEEASQIVEENLGRNLAADSTDLSDDTTAYSLGFVFSSNIYNKYIYSPVIHMVFRENTLKQIDLFFDEVSTEAHLWNNYAPAEMLKLLGIPDRFFISGDNLAYFLTFLYEDFDIAIEYTGYIDNVVKTQPSAIGAACFDTANLAAIGIQIYTPTDASMLDEAVNNFSNDSLEDQIGTSIDDFYQLLTDNPEACIQISLQIAGNLPLPAVTSIPTRELPAE